MSVIFIDYSIVVQCIKDRRLQISHSIIIFAMQSLQNYCHRISGLFPAVQTEGPHTWVDVGQIVTEDKCTSEIFLQVQPGVGAASRNSVVESSWAI